MNTRLRDIAEIRSGYPFRGRVDNDPDGDVAVVSMRDVIPGQPIVARSLLRISQASIDHVEKHLLEEDDVIFQSRGNRNHAAIIRGPLHGVAALGLYRIRPDHDHVSGEYLAWFLNQERFQRSLSNVAQGSHIPFVPRAELAMMRLPLPSLEDQRRISELHKLRERHRQVQKEMDDLTDKLVSEVTWRLANSSDRTNKLTTE
ncbi:MAG TPA: restriction endonuclease subunit S [Woeseiaceae bacterium]|nr:restriction endonuclease subunit S [Woeseiaceae bacterium]